MVTHVDKLTGCTVMFKNFIFTLVESNDHFLGVRGEVNSKQKFASSQSHR